MSKVIGEFTRRGDDMVGTLKTAFLDLKVRFVRDKIERVNPKAPQFHIMHGKYQLGAAWERQSKDKNSTYWSVEMDDPMFTAPINAKLVSMKKEPDKLLLIWDR